MKILLAASAYSLAEGFLGAYNALKRLGHEVTYYPLYMKAFEIGCELTKGKEMPDPARSQVGRQPMNDDIIVQAAAHDLVIFWKAESLTPLTIDQCSQVTKTVGFSWDDPYQLEVDRLAVHRAIMMHGFGSCCERSVEYYKNAGQTNAFWCPPGYDPEVHHEEGDPVVDVCFIGTNTYCKEIYGKGPLPPFDRRDLVKATLEITKSVELYGNGDTSLGWLHPVHGCPGFLPYYKGFIPFEQSRKAYSRARIIVNSHVRRTGRKYFNERTFQIMGCNREQLIDENPGTREFFDKGWTGNCQPAVCYSSIDDFKKQLSDLLKEGLTSKQRQANALQLSKDYTWDCWAQRILSHVS